MSMCLKGVSLELGGYLYLCLQILSIMVQCIYLDKSGEPIYHLKGRKKKFQNTKEIKLV